MPYKRRRLSYRRRRTTRRVRRGRQFTRFRRTYARRRRFFTNRPRRLGRFRRFHRRRFGGRRRIIRNQVIASNYKQPIYRWKRTRRQARASKLLKAKINQALGTTCFFNINQVTQFYHDSATEPIAGDFHIYGITPHILYQLYDYAVRKQIQGLNQDNNGLAITAGARNFFKFKAFKWKFEITNTLKTAVVLRFAEWTAKRDIPANLATEQFELGNWRLVHPILRMYQRESRQEQLPSNEATASFFDANTYVYNFYRNKLDSFPTIRYYYRIKYMKQVTVEPGAKTQFIYSYTPKMANNRIIRNLEAEYPNTYGYPDSTNLSSILAGIYHWKGLNDKGPMIEAVGIMGNTAAGLSTAPQRTAEGIIVDENLSINMLVPPYKASSEYNEFSATIQAPLGTAIVINKPELAVNSSIT